MVFRVWDSGFQGWDLGCKGLGFEIGGFGLKAHCSVCYQVYCCLRFCS